MSDSYVCSGATMRCTMGDSTAKLIVLPSRSVFLCGKPLGNITDHKSMVNLAPFGKCRSLGFPATATATAAHHGALTPMPCIHNTPVPWVQGKTNYLVKGAPALLKSCKCTCMWGGVISIIDDGQKGEGNQFVNKSAILSSEEFVAESKKNNQLSQESVLDGIQLTLDVAGFAPGIGAIPDLINASISAMRGNWSEAGLSLLAAVPVIGDAAAAVKIAKKGLKYSKLAKKCISKNIDVSIKGLVRKGLSVEDAKLFRKAVRNERKAYAKAFYEKYTSLSKEKIDGHLRGIDFNRPIKADYLPPIGKNEVTVYQYRNVAINTGKYDIPSNYFTTNPHTTKGELGIADFGVNMDSRVPGVAEGQMPLPFEIPKEQFVGTVTDRIPCLRSTSKRIWDDWSVPGKVYYAPGGAEQIFVPNNIFASEMRMIKR